MTVLIIFPERSGGLEAIPEEVRDLANNFDRSRLVAIGDSERPIFNEIDNVRNSGETIRGIWIASHAARDGVHLGSIILDVAALVVYVQYSGADWIVFNTCDGDGMARRLRQETGIATLAVDVSNGGRIDDRDAWRMAGFVAREMVRNGGDLEAAYLVANPRGGGMYMYRPSINDGSSALDKQAIGSGGDKIGRDLHEIDVRLTRLETLFESKIDRILQEVNELKEEFSTRQNPSLSWGSIAILAIISMVYFGALAFLIAYSVGA